MNISKHMEAIFLSATALFCAATYEAPAKLNPPAQDVAQVAQAPVQTVVVIGRRVRA